MSEPGQIQLTQSLMHPPARVWAALTEPALLAQWWAAGDVQPVLGHRFTLDLGPWGQQPCEILQVEPQRLLRYSFATGLLNTTITWQLDPQAAGTRLSLDHQGFDLQSPVGQSAFSGMSRGWPTVLARIDAALA